MVTIGNLTSEYFGLSTDEKPTDGRNGDSFVAMDEGKTYIYDEEGSQWVEQPASGGGGGGDSDFSIAEVTIDTKNATSLFTFYGAITIDDIPQVIECSGTSMIVEPGNNDITIPVILYKGAAYAYITDTNDKIYKISGNVDILEDNDMIIAGNCKIQIGGGEPK